MRIDIKKCFDNLFFFFATLMITECGKKRAEQLIEGVRYNKSEPVTKTPEKGINPNYTMGLAEYPDGTTSYDSKGKVDGIDYEQMPLLFGAISKNQSEVIKKLKEKRAHYLMDNGYSK